MPKTIADAVRIASKDHEFAADFVERPEDYKTKFNLTDAQIAKIKDLSVHDLLTKHVRGPNPIFPHGGGRAAAYY